MYKNTNSSLFLQKTAKNRGGAACFIISVVVYIIYIKLNTKGGNDMNKTKFRSIFGGLAMASLVFAMSCANPSNDSGKEPDQKQKVANVTFTFTDADGKPVEVKSGDTKEVTSGTAITLSCGTKGADIRYMLGDAKEDVKYTTPIEITKATTIKAFAERKDWDKSDTTEAKFTIKDDAGDGDKPVTPPETPVAVTDFAAENGGDKSVKLTWTPVEGGTDYAIAVKDAADKAVTGAVVGDVKDADSKKTATVTKLGEGVSYNFVITYKKGDKTSAEAKATAVTKPAAVTGVKAELNASRNWDSVNLTWTIPEGTNTADDITYEVTPKAVAGAATGTAVINEDKKGAAVSGLTASTAYTFTVTAKIGDTAIKTESAASGSVTTEATPTKLVALSEAKVPVITKNSVTLEWKVENTGSCTVTGFEVYKNNEKIGSALASNTTSYEFTGLKPNTKYTLKVVPLAEGASTTAYEVKDVCTKVANVTVGDVTNNSNKVTLNWTDTENALPVSYIITVYKDGGATAVEGLGKTVESTDKKITSDEIDLSKAEAGKYTFKIQVKGQGTGNTNEPQAFEGNVVIAAPKETIGDVGSFVVSENPAKNAKDITLTWSAPTTGTATKYNITCNQNVTFAKASSATNANTVYTVTGATTVEVKGMEAGTKYTFTIKAVGSTDEIVSSGNVTCEWTPAYTATLAKAEVMHDYTLPEATEIIVDMETKKIANIGTITLQGSNDAYELAGWKDASGNVFTKDSEVNADITLKPMFKSKASAVYAELAGVQRGFTDDHPKYPATYAFEVSGDDGKTASYKMGSTGVNETFVYDYKLIPETETTGTLSVFSKDGFHVGISKPVTTTDGKQAAITESVDLNNKTPAKVKIVFDYEITRDSQKITNIKLTTKNVWTGNGVTALTADTVDNSSQGNEVYVIKAKVEGTDTVKIDWSEFGVDNSNKGCAFNLMPAK